MRFRLRYQQHNLELIAGHFVIGRSTDCQLSVDDPLVSRRHARLVVTRDDVFLEDLGSRNGVLLDGKRVEGRVKLQHGARITVGTQELTLLESTTAERSVTGPASSSLQTFNGSLTATDMAALQPDSSPAVSPSRKGDALRLLSEVADKALSLGKAEEAERILASVLKQVLDGAATGSDVGSEVAERAARYAARLAAATAKGSWCDYVFDLYDSQRRVLPAPVVDDLYTVLRKVQGPSITSLRRYVATLKAGLDALGPNERFVLQRIEGLEKVGAWR